MNISQSIRRISNPDISSQISNVAKIDFLVPMEMDASYFMNSAMEYRIVGRKHVKVYNDLFIPVKSIRTF